MDFGLSFIFSTFSGLTQGNLHKCRVLTWSISIQLSRSYLRLVRYFSSVYITFVVIMVYCAAFDCNNDSRYTTGVSYHCFPSDTALQQQWLAKISRADLVVSKNSRLCSEHFTPDCYERDLKAELLGAKPRAILKQDAVPSLFSHRPPPKKPRLSSERRSLENARKEVRVGD